MEQFIQSLQTQGFKGEIDDSASSKEFYSHDASMFEIKPQLIVCPKDSGDVQLLIKLASEFKKKLPGLSLTGRSAGTDMSGGAINDSVIVDFNRHFTAIDNINAKNGYSKPGDVY